MSKLLTVLTLMGFAIFMLLTPPSEARAKPFRKALVLGGGGITLGMALGIIAGVKAAGYEPDVILTSCGASLGAALSNSFPDPNQALAYTKSEKFYRSFSKLVKLDSWTVLGLKGRLDSTIQNPDLLPPVFQKNILRVPEDVKGLLPNEKFPTSKKSPKFIIVAARSAFGPGDVGKPSGTNALVKEVFITDPSTAKLLEGYPSQIRKLLPYSRVSAKTETLTTVGMVEAARASITDPFYINPARIGNNYYFGGAVDLFPIETAQDLADEVMVNFPSGLYSEYEDLAVFNVYGFAQSDRTVMASQHEDVKWLDSSESNSLSMDPLIRGPLIFNKMPATLAGFSKLIDRQFSAGYLRGLEAARIQKNKNNVRSHLRYTRVGIK